MRWEVRTMGSGTSLFNGTIFKKTLTRYWPIWASYLVIWALVLPLQGLMLLRLDAASSSQSLDTYIRGFVNQVEEMAVLCLPMALIFGVICAMAACSHLYSARSANFFGALPVRREGQFLTHYLAGLSFLMVPNVVIFLLTLLVELAGRTVYLEGLLYWLGVSAGECFFFYSMAVFCGMFTGHILALPAFYGIFNLLAVVLYTLANVVCQQFYYGFVTLGDTVYQLTRWLTPVWKLSLGSGPHPATVEMYALAGLVLSVCAFFLYLARRLEQAGDVVSVRSMRPVFQYGVAIMSGLCLGMVTEGILNGDTVTLMVAMVVWAVAGYFVARMLLERSFRVLRHWKGAVATVGVFAVLFLTVGFDLTGFETRVPAPEQVASVNVDLWGTDSSRLEDSGDHLMVAKVTDPAFLSMVESLHRAAVEQRDGDPAWGRPDSQSTGLLLSYRLKNGTLLDRRYYDLTVDTTQTDQEGTAAWVIQQLYNDRALNWKNYGFEEAQQMMDQGKWRLLEVSHQMQVVGQDGYMEMGEGYYSGETAQALYEAVKEDFWAGRIGVRKLETLPDRAKAWEEKRSWPLLEFSFAQKETGLLIQAKPASSVRSYVRIRVQPTATSTLAVLNTNRASRPDPER